MREIGGRTLHFQALTHVREAESAGLREGGIELRGRGRVAVVETVPTLKLWLRRPQRKVSFLCLIVFTGEQVPTSF